MVYECDTEAERNLAFNPQYLIYTRDTDKFYKIYNNSFVEVLHENVQAPLFRSGTEIFNSETIKHVSYGITFIKKPKILLSLGNNSVAVPYKINETVSGFSIMFRVPYSGDIDWSTIRT